MFVGEQDVLRLDVAMDHESLVRISQGLQHVHCNTNRPLRCERPFIAQPRPKRPFGEVRSDAEIHSIHASGIQNGEDVGMLERGREPDLTPEAAHIDEPGNLGMDHFDGDRTAQLHVSS